MDEARRGEILLSLGEAYWAAGERERYRTTYAEAAALGRALGRVDLLAAGAVGVRSMGEMGAGPDPETLALLEEARDATRDGPAALHARVLSRLASSNPHSRSMERREALSRESYEIATACGDRTAIADALSARYWATLGPDRLRDRIAVGDEAEARGRVWQNPRLRIIGHEARISAYLVLGDNDSATREMDAYSALAEELRQPLYHFLARVVRGSHAMNTGRFDESHRIFEEALEWGRGAVNYAESLRAGTAYWLHATRGDFEAFANVETLLEQFDEIEMTGAEALMRSGLAHAKLARGDFETARREFDALAERGFATLERDEHWLLTMGSLAEVACQFGDVARASELARLLAPYAHLMVAHDLLRAISGTVHAYLGDLATTTGRFDEAEAHYAVALEREEAQGLVPALCNSRAGLARLHLQRGGRGARAKADALLARAEEAARAIGSQRDYQALVRRKLDAATS